MRTREVFGLVARYGDADALLAAARAMREAGYRFVEAYSPFPVDGLSEVLGQRETRIPWFVFWGGVVGGILGFMMQYVANVWTYPLNIGSRPFNSWPAFIPVTFELTILFAVLSGFVALVARCGMPDIYHPVFSAPGFERASSDRFFLCVMARDDLFSLAGTQELLKTTGAEHVCVI